MFNIRGQIYVNMLANLRDYIGCDIYLSLDHVIVRTRALYLYQRLFFLSDLVPNCHSMYSNT
jgi:hypothetical protein